MQQHCWFSLKSCNKYWSYWWKRGFCFFWDTWYFKVHTPGYSSQKHGLETQKQHLLINKCLETQWLGPVFEQKNKSVLSYNVLGYVTTITKLKIAPACGLFIDLLIWCNQTSSVLTSTWINKRIALFNLVHFLFTTETIFPVTTNKLWFCCVFTFYFPQVFLILALNLKGQDRWKQRSKNVCSHCPLDLYICWQK